MDDGEGLETRGGLGVIGAFVRVLYVREGRAKGEKYSVGFLASK